MPVCWMPLARILPKSLDLVEKLRREEESTKTSPAVVDATVVIVGATPQALLEPVANTTPSEGALRAGACHRRLPETIVSRMAVNEPSSIVVPAAPSCMALAEVELLTAEILPASPASEPKAHEEKSLAVFGFLPKAGPIEEEEMVSQEITQKKTPTIYTQEITLDGNHRLADSIPTHMGFIDDGMSGLVKHL